MLTETQKTEIRTKFKAISLAMPNFTPRPAQRIMIAEVAQTFARCPDPETKTRPESGSTILVAQGGTGTGKSLSYGLSGILMAKAKGKKLVISSSTVALQEQLINTDLPFFCKSADVNANIVLAKGRTRYVCQYKLAQTIADMSQASMFPRSERTDGIDPDEIRLDIESMAKEYASGNWNGDRDTRKMVPDEVWRAVTTDRNGCLNRLCPYFKSCAQVKARARVKEADVVVANHDLVLADLALGGGKILPSPEDSFYVFDEAHFLPDKAVNVFASSHLVAAERRSAEKLVEISATIADALGYGFADLAAQVAKEASLLAENLNDVHGFFESLSQLKPTPEAPRPTLEFAESCIPEDFFVFGDNIMSASCHLLDALSNVQETIHEILKVDNSKQALLEKLLADVGYYAGRAEEVNSTWTLFLAEPKEGMPPVAKWIETFSFKKSVDFKINSSPVVAGGYLKTLLWEKAAGVILTSATISTLGTFDDFLRKTGLSSYGDRVTTLDLPSPFDYFSQGTLEIPKFPTPKNYDGHTVALIDFVTSSLESMSKPEGMLVLFTSKRKLNDVCAKLPKTLLDRVLVQGTQSKDAIIREHKARIDAGKPSVIFGLESFSVGVDLAGAYCVHVVVTQLPFAVPDNPVLRALSGWITSKGGDPFMQISVPDAARKLEQSVGRLIRTEKDFGKVTVTDPRLWDTRFGRAILRGLPPFRVLVRGKEVAA